LPRADDGDHRAKADAVVDNTTVGSVGCVAVVLSKQKLVPVAGTAGDKIESLWEWASGR